ncbi:MAG: 4Fe-4S binding protein [Desulfobacterales bacterium]|nr:4Fe-4S binding protein [Desulfobacterales bacterium]
MNHIIPRLGIGGRKWLANHYHGKVLTPDQAEAIITLSRDIPLKDLEQIIPYPMARDLVLKGPVDVAVFQCGCRQIRSNPCQPIQVCMVIGQPFVDFILEHHRTSSRRLSQSEALELLRQEHERGHLHSAWFKDVMLNRFYAICNCCKCCCGGIEAMVKYGAPTMVPSGYVAQINETDCVACGDCVDACPFGALSLNGVAKLNWEKCMGCGVCVGKCPNKTVTLVRDERKGVPLDVRLLA